MNLFKSLFKPTKNRLSRWLLAAAALLVGASPASAQVTLGAASAFAVLGGTNVTCTAGSVITEDVGVSPGSAVPFTNTGCTFAGGTPPATNAAAAPARTDFLAAYLSIQSSTSCIQTPGNLAGLVLPPGTYCVDASAKAGTLTLNGPANGVWIFIVNGALTGTNFMVAMAGGGLPCNVFWAASGAATMTDSAFKGNILAGDTINGSVTLTRGTLAGRALANVAVTMTGTSVIGCGALSGPPDCMDKDHDRDHKDKDHDKCKKGGGHGEDCDRDHSDDKHDGKGDDRDGKGDHK